MPDLYAIMKRVRIETNTKLELERSKAGVDDVLACPDGEVGGNPADCAVACY